MPEDIRWTDEQRRNTLAAVDIEEVSLKTDPDAWADRVIRTSEELGSKDKVITGLSNLCNMLLRDVESSGGPEPIATLFNVREAIKQIPRAE